MTPVFDPLLPSPAAPVVRWGELYGAALSLALVEAALGHDGPLLAITSTAREAERLALELRFLAPGDLPVRVLPDYESLPYDVFSPHPDITSQRLSTLAALNGAGRSVLVVAIDALLMRLPPPGFVAGHTLLLAAGETIDLVAFRERLAAAGYAAVTQVAAPGEFALRGSSTCGRWARRSPTASTCSTTWSTASASSTPSRSARASGSTASACCRHASSR